MGGQHLSAAPLLTTHAAATHTHSNKVGEHVHTDTVGATGACMSWHITHAHLMRKPVHTYKATTVHCF